MKKIQTQEMSSSRNQIMNLIALGSFLLGAIATGGIVLLIQADHPEPKITGLRESDFPTTNAEYAFIDPLIGIKGVDNSAKYADLKNRVGAYIDDEKKNGLISVSVDFRDINEPGGFVLNPSEQYTPASLNKVPVMMAYYKIAETDPTILSNEIVYTGASNNNDVQEIKSAMQVTPGGRYTVEQLIGRMIRYSDNNAADLLTQHLKETGNLKTYIAVFSDLGVDPSVLTKYTDNMNVQEYSMFLRALYNATYLGRNYSERALKLLSETDFASGIESGVPNNILVAQKFGEVRMTDADGALIGKEINDCGIVYYPAHPYLLCIMTKKAGNDIKGLENEIASISSIIYKNMQDLYP